MKTTMICVLNSEDLAEKLGKKGTETDITLYNHKKGEKALSVVCPSRFPERLPPLLYALYLGDEVIMVVDKLDKTLGEEIIACMTMDKKKGTIVLENYIQKEQIAPLIKDTCLENWIIMDGMGDPNVMREELMEREPNVKEGITKVTVDHSFPVKGLGTVSLGIVDRGVVAKHQNLMIFPDEKKTSVRSIQVHDEDVDSTGSGSRVGLVLKNVEPDDVPRGSVLSDEGALSVVNEISLNVSVNKFWRDTLKDGMTCHLAHGMQFVSGKISMDGELKGGQSGIIKVVLDNSLALDPVEKIGLAWLDSTGSRIVGKSTVVEE